MYFRLHTVFDYYILFCIQIQLIFKILPIMCIDTDSNILYNKRKLYEQLTEIDWRINNHGTGNFAYHSRHKGT